jgi:hypothetical protein
VAAVELSSIELAVLAELNLEMARGYDEVVEDAAERLETGRIARALAAERRERARLLHNEARRVAAQATSRDPGSTPPRRSVYIGPERRKRARRTHERRSDAPPATAHLGGSDRRTIPDRRGRERRQPQLRLS